MSRKSRSQQRRASTAPRPPATTRPKRTPGDPLAFYRSIAAPSMRMRMVLVVGLIAYIVAWAVTLSLGKDTDASSGFALVGMAGILVFLGSGFVRHQRALFRIRRENPDAWQSSVRFAMSTLPIPLGFGGRPADNRERAIRWLTLALLLVFAVTSIAGNSRR
jgi:hypothetical protein